MALIRVRPGHPLIWGTAVLQVILSGCFGTQQPESRPSPPSHDTTATAAKVTLSVNNRHYLDVVIYVLNGGASSRVGVVTGLSSREFALPAHIAGQGDKIELLGDPIGSTEAARTESLVLRRGAHIQWTLDPDLSRSSVTIY
jgi:hypothetical protein